MQFRAREAIEAVGNEITVREVGVLAVALTISVNYRRNCWFRTNILSEKVVRNICTLGLLLEHPGKI
jgi:hypothetical protein